MTNRMTFDSGDLVMPGNFSTPKQIRAALAALRVSCKASFAVLAVFELPNRWFVSPVQESKHGRSRRLSPLKSRKLFRSLLFASHEKAHKAQALQSMLLKAPVSSNIEVPIRTNRWPRKSIRDLLRDEPFTCLADYEIDSGLHLVGRGLPVFPDPVHPLRIGVLLGVSSADSIASGEVQSALERLNHLVRNSEAVAVNRSTTLADTIDRVLRDCERYVASMPSQAFAELPSQELREIKELSRLSVVVAATALLLTESEVGDLFLTGKDPESLYLAGSCVAQSLASHTRRGRKAPQLGTIRMSAPLTAISPPFAREPQEQGSGTSKSVVQYVHTTGRPLVINGIPDFTEMHDAVHYTRPSEISRRTNIAELKELAAPVAISGALVRGDPAILGVLNLEKRYGRYGEMTCLWLDIWRSISVSSEHKFWGRPPLLSSRTSGATRCSQGCYPLTQCARFAH